jgi:hypothetical protein
MMAAVESQRLHFLIPHSEASSLFPPLRDYRPRAGRHKSSESDLCNINLEGLSRIWLLVATVPWVRPPSATVTGVDQALAAPYRRIGTD